MKCRWIRKGSSKTLVAFFAGFAADENLLSGLRLPKACDIVEFFDYRDLNFEGDFSGYASVGVVGWSFGVWAANVFAKKFSNVVRRIAVNGSPYPSDDARGIPSSIFRKTCDSFDEHGREKFFRRICGGTAECEKLSGLLCRRSARELSDELKSLSRAFESYPTFTGEWTCAFASFGDKIFSPKNLAAVFGDSLRIVEGAHLNPSLIGRAMSLAAGSGDKIRSAFEKKSAAYEDGAFVQREISETLVRALFESADLRFGYSPRSVLEIGCGTGFLTRIMSQRLPHSHWVLNDLGRKMCETAASYCVSDYEIRTGDFMEADFGGKYDLILSSSCFQWIEDRNALLKKIFSLAEPDSLFAFSTFGGENFRQIREIAGSGLVYDSRVELRNMLSEAGFSVLCDSENIVDISFKSPLEVLRHIRSTGVNGGFSRFWTPARAKDFCSRYGALFGDENGAVKLTYNPIYFVCKKTS